MALSFDFNSIKSRIMIALSAKSEWANNLAYGVQDTLVDAIAQEMAYQIQYKEYLTNENWWGKARNTSSLLVESPVHGYVVPRKIGAYGTLRISTDQNFAASYPNNITLPKYFQFSNGTTFVCTDAIYTLPANTNYLDLTCRQGKAMTVTFLALGNLFETKIIIDASIENTIFDLYVNDVLWTRVDSLFNYGATDLVYELNMNSSLTQATLKFGNDIFGKKLIANDSVKFQYITTLGAIGNISSTGNINTVEDQAVDALANSIKLYVTNTTAIVGGQDYPTIDVIRNTSPKVYQTGDRASNNDDYKTIISSYTYISKVNVWGAYEKNKDAHVDTWTFIPTNENMVYVSALDMSYNNLTTLEKNDIVTSIHLLNDPTDIISFIDVQKIYVNFYINAVLLNSSYSISDVTGAIKQALTSNYSIQYMNFNQNIYFSDFTKLIDNISGVRNHNSYMTISESYSFYESYIASLSLSILPVQGITLKIYYKLTTDTTYSLLATSDENGVLTGTGSFSTIGSSVNLSTGLGTLIVSSGLASPYTDYNLLVEYQTVTGDILIYTRNQIIQYNLDYTTVTYPTIS